MHIALLSNPSNFHCAKWANALVQSGAEVTVFTLEPPETPLHRPPLFEPVYLKPGVIWRGRYRYPAFALAVPELKKELKKRNVSLLHPLHITPFGTWGRMTGFRPCISAAIGADILEYTDQPKGINAYFPDFFRKVKKKYFANEVYKTLHYSDLITADNATLIDAMKVRFCVPESKIKLLRWGIEPERFNVSDESRETLLKKLNIPTGSRLLLSPRGVSETYQPEIILKSFAQILNREDFPADLYVMVLASEYGIRPEIEKRLTEYENKYPNFRAVRFRLDYDRMSALWTLTDVFISAPVYDGYSAVLAEGRYAGAVPVVNDIPGNREEIFSEKNGFIVHPFTAERLAETLIEVLKNRVELRARFAPVNKAQVSASALLSAAATDFIATAQKYARPSFPS